MRTLLLVGAVAAVGCAKQSAAPGPVAPSASSGSSGSAAAGSTADQDALWALAPDGARLGFVASPRGVAMLEHGLVSLQALLVTAPELSTTAGELAQELTRSLGTANPTLAEFGLSHDKGIAVFLMDDGTGLAILPVVDRDRFLARLRGTKGPDNDRIGGAICRTIKGLYFCADNPRLFVAGRAGVLAATLATAGGRGDLELASDHFKELPIPRIAAVAQLERGAAVLRGSVTGLPHQLVDKLGSPSALPAHVASTIGFGVLDLAPLLQRLPSEPITPGGTVAAIGASVAGPMTFIVSGSNAFDVRIPLRDPAPLTALVQHCADLPSLALIGATVVNGGCHLQVPSTTVDIDAWVEGRELRIGTRGARLLPTSLAPSPLGLAIAGGAWAAGFYGRGSLLAVARLPGVPDAASLSVDAAQGLRTLAMINELGLGLRRDGDTVHFVAGFRTAWANPDDVLEKLIAISARDIVTGKAFERARAIAAAAPTSPFAGDVKTGLAGLLALLAPVGVVAGFVGSTFEDHGAQGKPAD